MIIRHAPQLFPNTNQWRFSFKLTMLLYSIIKVPCPDHYLFTFLFSFCWYHFQGLQQPRSWSQLTLNLSPSLTHLRPYISSANLKNRFVLFVFSHIFIYILLLAQINSGRARVKLQDYIIKKDSHIPKYRHIFGFKVGHFWPWLGVGTHLLPYMASQKCLLTVLILHIHS